MKVLTGALRGQKLLFKPNAHLRPTSDKTRKAIFDILRGALEGARVLDLFSGTGALGIEALSSGASAVTFVELDRVQSSRITENLKQLKLLDRSTVITAEVFTALKNFSKAETRFDLIFADPPYEEGLGRRVAQVLSASTILAVGGILVLECQRNEEMLEREGSLKMVKSSVYGDSKVVIYSRNGS